MDLRDALQEQLAEQGVPGVVTNYMLTICLIGTDGHERVINYASDGTGMTQHLGMVAAARLTAEGRYFASDDQDPEGQAG